MTPSTVELPPIISPNPFKQPLVYIFALTSDGWKKYNSRFALCLELDYIYTIVKSISEIY